MLIQFQKFKDLYDALSELLEDKEKREASVHSLFESTLEAILKTDTTDFDSFLIKATALTDYCNEAILIYHFKDVPIYWRRMVMDAGLLKVLIQLKSILNNANKAFDFKMLEPQVQSIISDLDTCSIVSGSPGPQRRSMALSILNELQAWLTNGRYEDTAPVFKKSKKMNSNKESSTVELNYPIKRLDEPPSFESFLEHCNQDVPTPFIIPSGVIDHWPAFNEHPWGSVEYLLSIAADRVVPIEIGSQYTDSNWQQTMMRFSDFVNRHILKQEKEKVPAYLAQHDLFYQIPSLEKDILIPDYCYIKPNLNELYLSHAEDVIKNAWFGPKGTISPLHQDPYHNLLCQVVGSKYLRLISPQQTSLVYPREGLMTNTSQVDVEDVNEEQFPLFKEVNYVECVLKEGEVLYIPPKWWHFVKSLETSFSVSLWF
ncbi:uncharacterized protein BX663DRAFT_437706 [Cokeromyces recurvatus]|uniref:uncharacterized protein n=1 Tax=Cokeromyces recurvatus TaxID=90255 RepID=UPI0022206E61|nr:uncharacterized protein BX663DRAFT_437706 [Cokeromyces recurvatus]KAI7901102.1 hypothetical protein BX663DRAFT_437706 [Cokeromyces recurvatus]